MGFRLLPASSIGAMDLFSRVAAVEVRNFDPYTDNLRSQRQDYLLSKQTTGLPRRFIYYCH